MVRKGDDAVGRGCVPEAHAEPMMPVATATRPGVESS